MFYHNNLNTLIKTIKNYIYNWKSIHPHKILEDDKGNNMDYVVDRPFLLFFSLFLWMHHMGTNNTAGGVRRFYLPTSPIHWLWCIWYQYYIFHHLFHWRDGRPLHGFSSRSSRCGSHTNDWFTSNSFVFCFFIYRQKFTPIRVHTVSFIIGWHWFFIFTLYIIYYSLCRGSFTIIWEQILLLKNIGHSPFQWSKGPHFIVLPPIL